MNIADTSDPTLIELVIGVCGILITLLGGGMLFFLKALYKELQMCAEGLVLVKRDIAVIRAVMATHGLKHLAIE